MAREIVEYRWCDICLAERDRRTDGTTVRLQIDGEGGELDLCPNCRKGLIDPLLPVLRIHAKPAVQAASGRATAPTAPRQAEGDGYPCPLCPGTLPHGSMRYHVQSRHGATLDLLVGSVCPLDKFTASSFLGLAVHINKRHPTLGPWEAVFAKAEAEGDPHGVVAQFHERVQQVREKQRAEDGALAITPA